MGSERSSRWGIYRKRCTVEEALSWDVNVWARQEGLMPGRIFVGTLMSPSLSGSRVGFGGPTGLMHYCADLRDPDHPTVELTYPITVKQVTIEDTVLLELSACPYGGHRLWFRCPICYAEKQTRCTRLYIPPGRYSFGCRQCHGLTYRSSQQSRHPSRVEPASLAEWNAAFHKLREEPMTRDLCRSLSRAIRNSGAG